MTNQRTDAYSGNSIEGRTRLHTQILKAVRREVGQDYPIAIRFGAYEENENGAKSEEAPLAAKLFEEAGADLIDVSGGLSGYIRKDITDAGYFRNESALIRKNVNIPVLTAGGVETRQQAEDLLNTYDLDLIGVARAILKDSKWPEKNL